MGYLTIRPVALLNSPWGEAEWAIDPWPLRAKGLIVLVSPNWSDTKGNNKFSKCKSKKYLFGGKNERKTNELGDTKGW